MTDDKALSRKLVFAAYAGAALIFAGLGVALYTGDNTWIYVAGAIAAVGSGAAAFFIVRKGAKQHSSSDGIVEDTRERR